MVSSPICLWNYVYDLSHTLSVSRRLNDCLRLLDAFYEKEAIYGFFNTSAAKFVEVESDIDGTGSTCGLPESVRDIMLVASTV